MRHRKAGRKLNRTHSHRKAMFRNMVTSLFKHDRIRTTDVKAKELRRWADHLITLAKRGDLHARRIALSIIRERDVVQRLFEEATDRYGNTSGGYTRIVKIGRRPGDAAPVSIIELVSATGDTKKKEKKSKKTAAVKKPAAETDQEPVEKEKTPEIPPEETSAVEAEAVSEPNEKEETPDETDSGTKSAAAEPVKDLEENDKEPLMSESVETPPDEDEKKEE